MRHRILCFGAVFLLTGCVTSSFRRGQETSEEITSSDVRSRIFVVADDSMLGREAGTEGNFKMTEYLAGEVARMGLDPAGDNGTFFQIVPLVTRRPDPASQLTVGNENLKLITDFAPIRPTSNARLGTRIDVLSVPTVFGGNAGDTTLVLGKDLVAGRLVVFDAAVGSNGQRTGTYTSAAGTEAVKYPEAAGIAIASLDLQASTNTLQRGGIGVINSTRSSRTAPGGILISVATANKLLGADIRQLKPGTPGRAVTAKIGFIETPVNAPARNVIAVKRGADPALRDQYVAVGAHSDHVGAATAVVEHDSLRAFNFVMRPDGQGRAGTPTEQQWSRIFAIRDSMRRIRPPRRDSIYNGADDDGSGSVALLEIAELFADQQPQKRSVLFVWHTAEEGGILGSWHFVDNATVPRESIVAQINMDMVGRGRAEDTPRGGPRNLQAIGMRRLSTELGDVVDSVNRLRAVPWEIDLTYDAPTDPNLRYCRSDHQNYARQGIPIAYFSRGSHRDYHAVTDEAQYIDYDALSRVAGFVHDVVAAIANRNDKPRIDKRLPNPLAPCRQ